jgi:hypothetical protein
MAIDPHFIPAFSIETVILDKDTGAPLSGGQVSFEEDNQRGLFKPIYQITGTSPAYTYTQLPNPMTLSSIGTFEDSLGNPVVPYFFPFKEDLNGGLVPDYYFVKVTSFGGVEQFTREAVPYIPENGETSISSIITNEISNPQFAQVLFDTTTASTYTYTFSGASAQVVHIAPDWDLVVTCPTSGSVTVGQLAPPGADNIVTNPATILNISSAGITKLLLRQRLLGSPNLWGNGFLSASFVAKTYSGTPTILNLYYSQSAGTVMSLEPIVSATLPPSGAYGAFPGSLQIPISDNPQDFPNAYVDIFFDLPLSVEIDITSVIVSGTGADPIDEIIYDQVPVARQIDQLYHYSYPIIPIGAIIDFGGFIVPAHYYACDGSAKNRITNYLLFKALTTTETVILTNAVNTFTVVSTANYHIGMAIEGLGIPASTTISNIVGTTITMSAAAVTPPPTTLVTFFAWGNGDGSTTFNVPNLQGIVTAGNAGTLFSNVNGVGLSSGASTVTLTPANMPVGVPTNTGGSSSITVTVGAGFNCPANNNPPGPGTPYSQGSATPVSIVQPTALVLKCIRFE